MRSIRCVILRFILLLSLLAGAAIASAQEPPFWSVWLYDQAAGRMIQVDASGDLLNDVQLPAPAAYGAEVRYSRGVSVSADGTRIVYRVSGTDSDGSASDTFIIYDVTTEDVVSDYTPDATLTADTLDLNLSLNLFNQAGGAVAIGYATDDNTWRLLSLDVETGSVLFDLAGESVQAQLPETLPAAVVPVVQAYAGGALDFVLAPYQTGAFMSAPAYRWDIVTDRVRPTEQYATLINDRLPPTGEVIMPVTDERLPLQDDGLITQNNALHVFAPGIGGRFPYFADDSLSINRAFFIEDGQRTLLQADDLRSTTGDFIWRIVARDGTQSNVPALAPIENQVLGTPRGFLYVVDNPTPVLIEVLTADGSTQQRPVWNAEAGLRPVPVWVSEAFSAQAIYNDWAQLAPPIFAAQTVLPQATPQNQALSPAEVATPSVMRQGVLTVNGVAIINTTEDDRLNMRSRPGLSGAVVARVENGTRVVLLEGPRAADGFIWWEVRLSTGLTGWVVERADGVETLIPVG